MLSRTLLCVFLFLMPCLVYADEPLVIQGVWHSQENSSVPLLKDAYVTITDDQFIYTYPHLEFEAAFTYTVIGGNAEDVIIHIDDDDEGYTASRTIRRFSTGIAISPCGAGVELCRRLRDRFVAVFFPKMNLEAPTSEQLDAQWSQHPAPAWAYYSTESMAE